MKNILAILLCLFTAHEVFAYDISGIQPVAPYGVLSTFGTESLPRNGISLELTLDRSREPDFYRLQMKGAFGISDNLEFLVTLPYVYDFQNSIDGVEDLALGLKHRFYDEGKFGPSFAYIVSASIPSGRDDISSDGRFGVGLVMSKRVGPFRGSFNIFYHKPGKGSLQDELLLSSGLDLAVAHNSSLLAEFIAKKAHYDKEYNQLEARLGYRLKTTESVYTTIGAGTDFKNRSPEYRFIVSVCFTRGGEKKKIKKVFEEE